MQQRQSLSCHESLNQHTNKEWISWPQLVGDNGIDPDPSGTVGFWVAYTLHRRRSNLLPGQLWLLYNPAYHISSSIPAIILAWIFESKSTSFIACLCVRKTKTAPMSCRAQDANDGGVTYRITVPDQSLVCVSPCGRCMIAPDVSAFGTKRFLASLCISFIFMLWKVIDSIQFHG